MLGDIKSFFTKSSVGEVTVGLTIGAAFTNVMTAATETGRGLLSGDLEYAGLVQAVIALIAAALFSLFAVVKPLAKLKAMADRTQVDLVARAAGDEASLTPPLAEEGVDDGLVADTSADPTIDLTDEAGEAALDEVPVDEVAVDEVGVAAVGDTSEVSGDLLADVGADAGTEVAGGTVATGAEAADVSGPDAEPGVAVDDLPITAVESGTPRPAPTATYAWAGTSTEGSALERVATPEAAAPDAGGADATAPDAGGAGAAAAAADGGAAAAEVGGVPAAAAAETPTVLRAAPPHSHQVTKVCPYCAFDIPAVASRCGYCTADLTDAQRVAGVVLVDQQP